MQVSVITSFAKTISRICAQFGKRGATFFSLTDWMQVWSDIQRMYAHTVAALGFSPRIYAQRARWRRGTNPKLWTYFTLPRSSMLSVIFISWSIFKPSSWLSVFGCCCCCCWGWGSVCSHCPFTAAGSTSGAGSGMAAESGGAGSVIFSAGCGSYEARQKCHTWARGAGFQPGRDPETEEEEEGGRETPCGAAGPVAPN